MSSAPDSIELRFVNMSNDRNNSDILIFQKNEIPGLNELPLAWKVIRNCGKGWSHKISYTFSITVAVSDASGNHSQQLPASAGDSFAVYRDVSGHQLMETGENNTPQAVQFKNQLSSGNINAFVYRGGSVVAAKKNIAPGQAALFMFKPTIFIGVASHVTLGETVREAIVSQVNTEISLLGIRSADIVMTGGGEGKDAVPYTFTLQNVQMA
jgi:hypothetical protein